MKKQTVVMMLVLCGCNVSLASVKPVLGAVGNDNSFQLRLGLRGEEGQAEAGLFGVLDDEMDATGFGVYGMYDVMKDQEFKVLTYTVPATFYVGGFIGAVSDDVPEHVEDADAIASLFTGILFGDERAQIGPEYQYGFNSDFWNELGEPDEHQVMLNIRWRF